ncbi:acetyltransferase [Oceanobacillus sp. E9]|uniref:GNAT family N-acetyltransferase n=1 Tax=Oceanobacillus TaxID=182709 RepID=UPI00084E738E|nr:MULTISPECIES: GNAT family N-acetyltransferase [Oceanobacillus]OEH53650.1 acetyltransferase [Oceanobacillus sp. E9]
MIIRKYKSSDTAELVDLFYETVHVVNKQDYTKEQLHAWAQVSNKQQKKDRWYHSLNKNITYVAVMDNIIVGFIDMEKDGYLNRLFVHKDYQRQGIAKRLYNSIEDDAKQYNIEKLYTNASITAKPFFIQCGFTIIQKQEVNINGVILVNYKMSKIIRTQKNVKRRWNKTIQSKE